MQRTPTSKSSPNGQKSSPNGRKSSRKGRKSPPKGQERSICGIQFDEAVAIAIKKGYKEDPMNYEKVKIF